MSRKETLSGTAERAAGQHRSRLRSQRLAFGIIRGLSVLTIAILAAIIGFVFWKGLRHDSETRSKVLSWGEAAPNGFAIVVNRESGLRSVEYQVLRGIYTDEYLDWSKIDGEGTELLPIAVDPATPEGRAARDLIFGRDWRAAGRTAAADGASPAGDTASTGAIASEVDDTPWGGLVQRATSPAEALDRVAANPGAIAVVPAALANGRKDIAILALRRLALAANAEALALAGNSQVEDLDDRAIARLTLGDTHNWKELGGPDLAVTVLSPPPGSALAGLLEAAGIAKADRAIGPTPANGASGAVAADAAMTAYMEALASRPGAVGYVFAEDLEAARAASENAGEEARLGALTRVGRDSGWNLDLAYLVEEPRLSGRVGGISSIILNTFLMLALTLLLAAPLGVAAAVYLVEYARQGPLLRLLRLGTETLAGIPSIIFGLFGFLFFVNILHFGFGLLSGCLTLTLMILPTIVRTSEEALKSVPRNLREGSLALGATKLTTIVRVVIPAAAPGILTGLILGIGRAVGETAALLFTMGSDYKLAKGLFSSARVLSAHIYLLFAEGISFDRAFSTATVLILIVLAFNLTAKRLVGRMGRS